MTEDAREARKSTDEFPSSRGADEQNGSEPVIAREVEKYVIDALKRFNFGWKNKDYNVNLVQSTGPGKVYGVSFVDEGEEYYENYVYVRRSSVSRSYDPVVCKDVRDLVKSLRFGLFSAGDPDITIRNLALAAICVILVLAIAYVAVASDAPQLEPLIAFAGLVAGYLAGKAG